MSPSDDEIPRGQVFGTWDAPITDGDEHIDTPVGATCVWCLEAIAAEDNGRISPMGHVEHRECSLRNVMGGIGHWVDHENYCHDVGPDAGLSRRQSALMVWELFRTEGMTPSVVARRRWQLRVEEARGEL